MSVDSAFFLRYTYDTRKNSCTIHHQKSSIRNSQNFYDTPRYPKIFARFARILRVLPYCALFFTSKKVRYTTILKPKKSSILHDTPNMRNVFVSQYRKKKALYTYRHTHISGFFKVGRKSLCFWTKLKCFFFRHRETFSSGYQFTNGFLPAIEYNSAKL